MVIDEDPVPSTDVLAAVTRPPRPTAASGAARGNVVGALDELVRRAGPGRGRHRVAPEGVAVTGEQSPRRVSWWLALAALVVAAAVGWLAWGWLARPAPVEDRMPMAAGAAGSADGEAMSAGPAAGTGAATPAGDGGDEGSASASVAAVAGATDSGEGPVTVHVAGAVARPGVVTLTAGSRVSDAVDEAGGPRADADLDRLNLAAPLTDGARIAVPAVGAEPPSEVTTSVPQGSGGGGAAAGAPVDLNQAGPDELEELPGVGPATAAAIITHRERNGPFRSVEDLLDVRGIGEAKLEAIRDLATVS